MVLDQTVFFPEGGGQYADTGVLGTVNVTDVHEKRRCDLSLYDCTIGSGKYCDRKDQLGRTF